MQKFCSIDASNEPGVYWRTTLERALFMLQMVTAGNGKSLIDVETAARVMITGDNDHFSYTFDMK